MAGNNHMPDWRIGLRVTPKLRSHPLYGQIGVIRRIIPDSPNIKEFAEIEVWDVEGLTQEPTEEWMTAKQFDGPGSTGEPHPYGGD